MTPADLEQLIRRDPARRGLLSGLPGSDRCDGHLAGAAQSLAGARRVGIVTGFYVPDADPPAAETDGLSGSVLLADVLRSSGVEVLLITDELCAPALIAAAAAASCRDLDVLACPCETTAARAWRSRFWSGAGSQLTHLVAIERVASSCSPALLRTRGWSDELLLAQSAPAEFGRCHNMRGVDIHEWTADLDQLFEESQQQPTRITTIGIGDGGNEIGMGSIPWPRLVAAIPREHAARIAAATQTDFTILAGVSDWGAMALAVALCRAAGNLAPLDEWSAERIERLLQLTVRDGPAIDGITRQAEPTVDGLPFITYIQPWLHIRGQLGLEPL